MKILQLLCFPLYGSGSGTFVRKLSESLTKRGHEIAIVCPDNRQIKGVRIYEVKLPFMAAFTGHPEYPEARLYSLLSGALLNDIQAAFQKRIIEAAEKFQPDVIHVHHASNLSWIANYIKAVYQIHFVVTSHNTDIINAVLDKRYIPLTQDALNRADIITAVSDDTRKRLLRILGKGYSAFIPKTKIVPCGVDTKMFPSIGSVKDVDKKYRLKGKKVALYSGKITTIKGVDYFVRAAEKFPEAIFVVMGDGGEISKMKELASKNHGNNVIFTGYLGAEDRKLISQLYRRANVVAIPSTVSEGIPLSALEGMSAGSVVVASNIGGIPTAVRHRKTGILVKPRSLSALVEGIKLIFENEKLEGKLSSTARADAIRKFDWSVIAERIEKYYQIPYRRSLRNRATKKPSYITDEVYQESKEFARYKRN